MWERKKSTMDGRMMDKIYNCTVVVVMVCSMVMKMRTVVAWQTVYQPPTLSGCPPTCMERTFEEKPWS